ncbi:hmt-1 [Pristionchus pacificus]|uniref:ATP-binding cassette sub-family B member 6 n=1 Tax=Pristionchus pacificus TaxID=54126 RepID=A0A2A6CHR1_PRIPA|nr:hmt-1 [Pristionchus pacificus]|eukprot:PDM77669.1 hmt-1 [Pristionchus pacificus]
MGSIAEICPAFWPIAPSCSYLISFGVLTSLSIVTLIAILMPKRQSIPYTNLDRGGERTTVACPLSFVLGLISIALELSLAVAYIFYVFYVHEYSHILFAYCLVRVAFWLLALVSFAKMRSSTSLLLSIVLALVLQSLPFTDFGSYFPKHAFSNGQFVFFVVEYALIGISLIMVFAGRLGEGRGARGGHGYDAEPMMNGGTAANNRSTSSDQRKSTFQTWEGFSRKCALMAPYVWPKKSLGLQLRVAVCLFLLLFGRLINVALPLYNKWIVDGLSTPATFSYWLIVISSVLKFLQGNGAMGGFLNTIRTYLWVPIQQYTTREIEVELFEHLHALSLRWHLSRKTGMVLRVMDRGTNSINQILNYLLFNIVPTIADILIAVVFFFSAFSISFGFIVLITMIAYLVCTIKVTEWRTKFQREMNEKDNASSAIGTDSLLNYETVKYYGNEQFETDRFRQSIVQYQEAEWKSNASLMMLNVVQNSLIGVGMTVGSILVVYFIKIQTAETLRPLSVGDYVLFTTYMLQLYAPLNFFGTVYRVIQKSFIDMEQMFDLMAEDVEVKDAPDASEYHLSEGRISMKDLTFEYHPGKTVLSNIDFSVSSGETVALVGPSGSGKSTIIRLLFRLFEACDGSIEYDDADVRGLKMSSLRKQIGIVPQDTVLFNDTIRYNIRFGRPSATDEEVEEAARAAMIHDKILTLPNGYDTVVGERGLKLSGGEKQRVAIARTILKQPQFIFLDELCASRTSVVVAHRLSTIVRATQILVLDKGRIAERGTHQQLLEADGIYARMWASQMAESTGGADVVVEPASDEPTKDEEEPVKQMPPSHHHHHH